ncbi:uncharacterized protein LOC107884622 [Acyrthosiphon pisum]|uniref:Uncharacterized protein n=1 Tax=Acyrthosiphon pisum TaxID=7029 RepID=A0A8R2D5K7_ACYPI|nr:uncharacterized protein LOC107884622 [Acyrthosiphon pisum]|eukprot:XP_016662610.1 PREDICTED: uncharacterized protein LOC107884622 [Acyrthosiphon pisum]
MAMFGTYVKIGLSSSLLSAEAVEKSTTEQELEEILQSVVSDYEHRDNHKVSDKEDSTVSSCCESCGCTLGNGQTSTCGLCDKKNTIENEKSNSKLPLEQQGKKNTSCNVGDTVRVKLPEVDIGKGDPQNVLFAVVSISDNQYYELGNKNGTLHQLYSRNQFTVCSEPLIDILEVLATKKSFRKIANVQSFSGSQGFKKCLRKTKCLANKCK